MYENVIRLGGFLHAVRGPHLEGRGRGVEEFGKEIQLVKNCTSFDTPALVPKGRRGGFETLCGYRRTPSNSGV